jgi:hypothetical protein
MSETIKEAKLSGQAIGAIMMALQRSLMEQSDIVPVFQEWTMLLNETDNFIYVKNPPLVKVSVEDEQEEK